MKHLSLHTVHTVSGTILEKKLQHKLYMPCAVKSMVVELAMIKVLNIKQVSKLIFMWKNIETRSTPPGFCLVQCYRSILIAVFVIFVGTNLAGKMLPN